ENAVVVSRPQRGGTHDHNEAVNKLKSCYASFAENTTSWIRSGLALGKAAQELFEAYGSPKAGGIGTFGLRAIVAQEAPELNYGTVAKCWMLYKKGVAALGGGNKGAAALLGMTSYFNERGQEVTLSKALIQKRDTLFLEGTSRRKFLIMMAQMGQGSAGRKPGENLESYQNLRKDPATNAEAAWAKVFAKMPRVLPDMASLLPFNLAQHYLSELERLTDALQKRIKEEVVDV
ncbi:MAG: hypothetical protein IKO64_06050, partial [Kiritimatiellae bacterium]|nr:hypothetical protein [Kiritimatiellia bacterium]